MFLFFLDIFSFLFWHKYFFCILSKVLWESLSTVGSFWCFVQRLYFYLLSVECHYAVPKEERYIFFCFFPRWISKIKLAMFQGPASTILTFLGKIQKASHNNDFYLKDYFGPFSCLTSDYFLASIFFWNRIESDVIQKKTNKKPSKIKWANKLIFFSKIVLFCCKKIRFSISYKKLGLHRHKATANIFGSL